MFDDLRKMAGEEPDLNTATEADLEKWLDGGKRSTKRKGGNGQLFGMTAKQRFILVLMVFFCVLALGLMALMLLSIGSTL